MMRLACLYVPDFPLAAVLRTQPDLHGERLAIADGQGPRAKILAVSAEAARYGVTSGLSVAQALAIDAGLIVRPISSDLLRAAQAALCDAAASFSPRIEDTGDGIVYLDLEGLGTLFESESQLANALAQRATHLGLDAQVGVAGSKVAAALAARNGGGATVIPSGEEWSFLAPVAIGLLGPSSELAATLQRWGIRSIGDLAALPTRAVGTRLGPEGVLLVRRARGEDDSPLVPRSLPLHFEEGIDLEYGIETVEPCLFVVRGLLDRLTARLALRGLVCGDLRLSLQLATRGRDERTIPVAAPSNDVKSLLALIRLQLETHPPATAIEAIRVVAVPERLRATQLDLFRPNGPAPARLAMTLARLMVICGADRVGTPALAATHRPDAYEIRSLGCYAVRSLRKEDDTGAERVNLTTNNPTTNNLPLALRAMRPPRAVDVFCERDRPEFVRGEAFAGRVVQAAGPWRVQGEWWNERPYARDYYDAQLSDGCVYRLFCDLGTRSWFVDGVYD
jgi:protein ImuB